MTQRLKCKVNYHPMLSTHPIKNGREIEEGKKGRIVYTHTHTQEREMKMATSASGHVDADGFNAILPPQPCHVPFAFRASVSAG